MNQATLEIIKTALRNDPGLNKSDRIRLLQILRNPVREKSTIKPEPPRILRRREVAARLGIAIRTVDLLAKQGVLKPFVLPGRERGIGYRSEDIDALIQKNES